MSADIRLLRWPDRQRDDYERLTTALAKVRESVAKARGELTVTVPTAPEEPSDLDRARVLLSQRRSRDVAAGSYADMFADPAWDMLLALFVADGEGRAMDLDILVVSSAITRPAALRWIALLVERGLVERGLVERAPVEDGRAEDGFVEGGRGSGTATPMLTDAGRDFVARCLGVA